MARIELKNVRKSYGAFDVIKGVNLDIRSGEFMVFVGPSGCGKSTLLRLISGLEDITSGEMLFDGERVNHLRRPAPHLLVCERPHQLRKDLLVHHLLTHRERCIRLPH